MQKIFWDRRVSLRLLDHIDVLTPTRLEVSRDGGPRILTPEMVEYIETISGVAMEAVQQSCNDQPLRVELLDNGDVLSVNGVLLRKPFVEKPVNENEHDIIIYYPGITGGGARKLFRTWGSKPSEFIPDLVTPRAITKPKRSYIYEQLIEVDNGEDVKVYAIGPTCSYANTRKSRVIGGRVRRNIYGKEIRYMTALSGEEEETVKKVSTSFGQLVCGLNLLRSNGKSYVNGVKGWTMAEDDDEYLDTCALILRGIFTEKLSRVPRPPSVLAYTTSTSRGNETPPAKLAEETSASNLIQESSGDKQDLPE